MPYLKVEPDTYTLTKRQMFQFETCQFCGSTDYNFRIYRLHNISEASRGNLANVIGRRSCMDCGKTTALVKSKLD